jgi:hypothetical protein
MSEHAIDEWLIDQVIAAYVMRREERGAVCTRIRSLSVALGSWRLGSILLALRRARNASVVDRLDRPVRSCRGCHRADLPGLGGIGR